MEQALAELRLAYLKYPDHQKRISAIASVVKTAIKNKRFFKIDQSIPRSTQIAVEKIQEEQKRSTESPEELSEFAQQVKYSLGIGA